MLNAWIDDELAALDADDMRRALRISDPALINFASNDYLNLSRHPDVIAGAEAALRRYGAGAASSRLLSGHMPLHAELEAALAALVGQEAALVFPAGYMANLGVITALAGPADAVILDRLCHASLIDAARLSGARLFVYRHADAADAERVLRRAASYRRRVFVTESLFSMDGDTPPLPTLRDLARHYNAVSVVDEAHAIGVAGPGGKGLSEGWDVVMGTLSKSLGAQGGFASGSQRLMHYLVNKARPFMFTTGLSPACAGPALAALGVMRRTPALAETVDRLGLALRAGARHRGWRVIDGERQIVPLWVGEANAALRLSDRLRTSGFYAPAIRPPAVHVHECRLRLSVTAGHRPEDIHGLLEALGDA